MTEDQLVNQEVEEEEEEEIEEEEDEEDLVMTENHVRENHKHATSVVKLDIFQEIARKKKKIEMSIQLKEPKEFNQKRQPPTLDQERWPICSKVQVSMTMIPKPRKTLLPPQKLERNSRLTETDQTG